MLISKTGWVGLLFVIAAACGGASEPSGSAGLDAGHEDAMSPDAVPEDTGSDDADPEASAQGEGGDDASGVDGFGGLDTRADTARDASFAAVNGCGAGAFVDATGATSSRTLIWDHSIEMAPERCLRVAAGQTVTFKGEFIEHPIASFGGNPNNPVPRTIEGETLSVTFAEKGVFGFHCTAHPEMRGAIEVVE